VSDTTVAAKQPLSEVMLAMDVVDTLRHRQRVVERALSADEQDAQLIARLREIYAGQGIEVSDAIIERGVRDLREDRFAYTPSPPSFGRSLAGVYVSRGRWGKPLGLVVVLLAIVLAGYQTLVRGPEMEAIAALPGDLQSVYSAVIDLAESPNLDAEAAVILDDGEIAIASQDYRGARDSIARLESMRTALAASWEVRVRVAPGELSGVWRIPDVNTEAQNYYLIVEAIDANGDRLTLPITNEEDGRTYNVRQWGQRVDESTFRSVAADKSDDGIIQNNRIGEKRRGVLEPEFRTGVLPGAITRW
jgi:hypothetical protein